MKVIYQLRTKGHEKEAKHLIVDPKVHALVKAFAQEQGITMTHATHILLGKALFKESGLDYNANSQDSDNK